ncbi:hypothetical protein QF035_000052 [Streptomyces umbrinus]|uniref:Uncharacterized protein n=1 Tax=Streptomyces umbrinus TaxID=67370 RepID=A0ABU0SFY9_9ACTN|nr:hypothetical protein [Streptomyces umbrinus]MDQ1022470.1 hypothetical protein [Streptomyces umbrinus]
MAHTLPLRAPLDDNGLPHREPAPAPALVTETSTDLGRGYRITPEGMTEIWERLRPHLPTYLTAVHQHPTWLKFEFAPFTGREKEPSTPDVSTDPKLGYGSDDTAERALRKAARGILHDLYEQAGHQWRDAAYAADLKEVVQDADALWKAYQRELTGMEAAYAYLRSPEAGAEWRPAVSRLIDAQDRALRAAEAFDCRAVRIAEVHRKHLYADYGHAAALAAAGYPRGADWPIADADDYGTSRSLAGQLRRTVENLNAHVAKVARLSGTATV